jgi:hypothetical protein
MAETPHFTYSLQVGDAADSDMPTITAACSSRISMIIKARIHVEELLVIVMV